MTPSRHPSDALIFDYAGGALRGAARLVVDAHVQACACCAQAVAAADAVGGALLEGLPPAPLAPDALALALARIERPAPPSPSVAASTPADWIVVPEEVSAALARRRKLGAGAWVAPIRRSRNGEKAYLLGIAPGQTMPRHTHRSWEMTLVLKGAFVDGDQVFRAGDFVETDEHVRHSPRVTEDGECVCLAATNGSLVGLDLMGRLLLPLLGL